MGAMMKMHLLLELRSERAGWNTRFMTQISTPSSSKALPLLERSPRLVLSAPLTYHLCPATILNHAGDYSIGLESIAIRAFPELG